MDDDDFAIFLTGVVGAIIGVIVGYFVYTAPSAESVSFRYWVIGFVERGVIWWAFGGAITGWLVGWIRTIERR